MRRFVPQANLASIDPVWTTATVTRNCAYLVFNTLFGTDDALVPRPQMAEGYDATDDGTRQRLAAAIQTQAFPNPAWGPLGQYFPRAAWRSNGRAFEGTADAAVEVHSAVEIDGDDAVQVLQEV